MGAASRDSEDVLPFLSGRDEPAVIGTSGGDRGHGPLMPRGRLCSHLSGFRASHLMLDVWKLEEPVWYQHPGEGCGSWGGPGPPQNPTVLQGEVVGLPWGLSSGPWFPVLCLAGK